MSYIGNTQQNQNYFPAVDFFSGNGSTTAFTLSRPVASTAALQVIVSNVAQNPSSAYTVNGNTITFTSAPPSGTNNIYVYYTSPNTTVVQPSQGTVYPSSLSTGGPSWDTAGNLTLDNGAADGAQLVLKSAGYSDWNLDNYSGRLRAYYGGTEYFTINSSGNVGIGTSSPASKLSVSNASSVQIQATTGTVDFRVQVIDANSAAYSGTISNHAYAFTTNNSERARIDSSGNLLVGTTAGSERLRVVGTVNNYASRILGANTSGTFYHVAFDTGSAQVGSISSNTTTTTYATSSDYRLKENVQPMQNALAVVQQLNPVTYTWKADGSDGQGFIAHELQAVVPDCVTGEKDATRIEEYEVTPAVPAVYEEVVIPAVLDEEGNVIAAEMIDRQLVMEEVPAVMGEREVPVYQGIDTSFLVATLTKAIQEQQAQIETLTTKVAALEAK